jgi:N6-adenosine-specific RNA methylase IME4
VRYRTIVADPPWDYGVWRSTTAPAYPSMPLDEIAALPVPALAEDDAHLYCWAVLPLMAEAFDVVRGWGFKPSTVLTWCKPGAGLGGGFRGNTEHLIVARRGDTYLNPTCARCSGRGRGANKCGCDEPEWFAKGEPFTAALPFLDVADGTWFVAPRGDHSAKPDLFLDLAERMSPGPRVELFARRQRLGWDTWGDEALNHIDLPEAAA